MNKIIINTLIPYYDKISVYFMYVVLKQPSDLRQLPQLSEKRNILVRLRMNGCSWCTSSQPDWDRMVQQARPRLAPQDAIAEVESSFVDQFKDFVEKTRGQSLPEFRGYPTTICITQKHMKIHDGRDTDSYMKLLEQIQSIQKSEPPMKPMQIPPSKPMKVLKPPPKSLKTKKTKFVDPRLQIVEYEDPDRGASRKQRRRKRRASRHAKNQKN